MRTSDVLVVYSRLVFGCANRPDTTALIGRVLPVISMSHGCLIHRLINADRVRVPDRSDALLHHVVAETWLQLHNRRQ